MDTKPLKRSIVASVFTIAVVALVLTSATYAWFTSNGEVYTSRVEAKTNDTDARLYISPTGGADFRKTSEGEITQINSADVESLQPVSTDDLNGFVYNLPPQNGRNDRFLLDKDAKRYYHGHVYIEAEVTGSVNYRAMTLYLDDVASLVSSDDGSLFANAGRIGLRLEGGEPVIVRMSESENSAADREWNTYVNDVLLEDGKVLHYNASTEAVEAADDPSVALASAVVTAADPVSLGTIELNRIYELEIFFWLEGTDPDCTNAIQTDGAGSVISLFGVLEE
jgi:hypothetical protein